MGLSIVSGERTSDSGGASRALLAERLKRSSHRSGYNRRGVPLARDYPREMNVRDT
jgi:hypothetical protein